MKHPDHVQRYTGGGLKALAKEISELRYDALSELLGHLSEEIHKSAEKDGDMGYSRLAGFLYKLSYDLNSAGGYAFQAWEICGPLMEDQ